jgi:2-amino-4-hydroxy-6-hydroxymethyldihydropteridine diphosphokinase
MHQRAFVLMPLAEIAPDLDVPGRGLIRQLLQDCSSQDVARIA